MSSLTIACITLNEANNLRDFFSNISEIADQIVVLDSFSNDETEAICREFKVDFYQNKFKGFGDQWNYLLNSGFCKSDWVMKMDPDERLSRNLKKEIKEFINQTKYRGALIKRNLYFNKLETPASNLVLRIWKNGSCKFTNVLVNEHPVVKGKIKFLKGVMHHLDDLDLNEWIFKQLKYSDLEAITFIENRDLAFKPKILGNPMQRKMFLKKYFFHIPFRYLLLRIFLFVRYFSIKNFKGLNEWIWSRILVLKIIELKIKNNDRNIKKNW